MLHLSFPQAFSSPAYTVLLLHYCIYLFIYICYDSITSPTDFSSYLNPGWATFNVFCSDSLANYQWQMNGGTGWVDLSNAGQFIGVDTDVLELTGVNLSMNNFRKIYSLMIGEKYFFLFQSISVLYIL